MDKKQLKKIVARLGLAGLLAGAGLVGPTTNGWGGSSCASCSGRKHGAGSTTVEEQKAQGAQTSCGGNVEQNVQKPEGPQTSCSGGTRMDKEEPKGSQTSCSGAHTKTSCS